MALPSLFFTVTGCTISVWPVRKVGCGSCCACGAITKSTTGTKSNSLRGCIRLRLEPETDTRLNLPHGVRATRQAERRTSYDRVYTRIGDAVQDIRRVNPP